MGPNLYTQTPNAVHMGGGFSSPFAANDAVIGNIYGMSRRGDSLGRFAANMPGHLLSLGGAASLASGFGLGGARTAFIGNTLGMGAMSMGPQVLATAALQYAASQISRGQQQNKISADLSKRVFGERNIGGLRGLGASRDGIASFSSAFREMANSSELLTNDTELKNVLNKFTDMKLLDTSKNLGEMATRVKKMTKTLREISMDLGTTLEGALPSVQRHMQMGFSDMDDVKQSIRTNRALRGVGISMSDSTITSFEMSQAATTFSRGGDKRIGALGAQRTLGNMSVAASLGLLTDEDLIKATGKRGEGAIADISQQSMQASAALMQSSYGHVLAAALGEVKDGQFTGNLDDRARSRLRSMTSDEISQLATEKMDEGGEASFRRRMNSGMGANMAAQLDMSEFSSVLDKIFSNEDQMSVVLQDLTGMRGQTLDVLLKIQNDSDKIVQETRRRTQELAIRNRLNSVVQQKFTLGGRLNTAYREMLAEPIGQPLQEVGSDISTSAGNYMDNYSTQILRHGILEGIGRGVFGMGMGEDQAEQSFDDRRGNLSEMMNLQFGEDAGMTHREFRVSDIATSLGVMAAGALGSNPYALVAGGASLVRDVANFGDDGKHSIFGDETQGLIDASTDLQEREYEAGETTTTFGVSDEGFLSAYRGEREDVKLSQAQKRDLLRGFNAAAKEDDLEDRTEVFAQTAFDTFGSFDNVSGKVARNLAEARGGAYGLAKQLANDETLTEGERRNARMFAEKSEKDLKAKMSLDDEERVIKEQDQVNQDLEDFFEFGSDGVETTYYGLGSALRQFEDDYLARQRKSGNYGKLLSYMRGLSDESTIRRLVKDPRFYQGMSAEDAVGLAKDIFGLSITKSEGEQAKTFFKSLVDKYTSDDSVEDFIENMQGGAKSAVSILERKIKTDGNMRKLAMKRDLENSDLGDEGLKRDLVESFKATTLADQEGTIRFFDKISSMDEEQLGKVHGSMRETMQDIKSMSEGDGTEKENLVSNIKEKYGDTYEVQQLRAMDVEELKTIAVRANIIQNTSPTRSSGAAKAMTELDPSAANTIMLELSESVTRNMASQAETQMRFNKSVTDNIKQIQHRTGMAP